MQSLLEKFRLHVSSERRRRREKKLPYRFRFALFHFIFSTSELCHIFLLNLTPVNLFFLHFTYPSDFLSFYFGALQAWARRFICVGRLRAEIRYRNKSKFYVVKLIKCPSKLTDIQNQEYFMVFFKHWPALWTEFCFWWSICPISSGQLTLYRPVIPKVLGIAMEPKSTTVG